MVKRKILISLCTVLAIVGGVIAWWFFEVRSLHPEVNFRVVHAAPGVEESCIICHKSPIPFTNCSDCHGAQSNIIGNNVYLRHHDLNDGCEVCHTSVPNDARYVEVPVSGHGFCKTCHSNVIHESPP